MALFAGGAVAVTLLGFGLCSAKKAKDTRTLEELLARAEEVGLPMTAKDLPNSGPIAKSENAFPIAAELRAATRKTRIQTNYLLPRYMDTPSGRERARKELAAAGPIIDLVYKASKRTGYRTDADPNAIADMFGFESTAAFTNGLKIVNGRAHLRVLDGDFAGAREDAAAVLRLSRLVSTAGGIDYIAMAQYYRSALMVIEAAAERSTSTAEIDRLHALVEKHPPYADHEALVKQNFYGLLAMARGMDTGVRDMMLNPDASPLDRKGAPDGPPLTTLGQWSIRDSLPIYIEAFERSEEGSLAMLRYFQAMDEEHRTDAETPLSFLEIGFGSVVTEIGMALTYQAWHQGTLACLDVVRHYRRTGKLPASLSALETSYIDPFSGKPFEYRLIGSRSFDLWSWGQDLDDDQGRAIQKNEDYEFEGDVVFSVRIKG